MTNRPIVIHGFETSNNLKVRVALEHKGLPYEFRTIAPRERDDLVRRSGQFLTPVMEHGETVLFDSAAILRYLDANFPDTPKLFGGSHREQWEIEDWERFGRGPLAEPMMEVVHAKIQGEPLDDESTTRAGERFESAVRTLEARLGGRDWLVGGSMSAADITCAAVIYRIRGSELLPWPDGCPGCERLTETVMELLD